MKNAHYLLFLITFFTVSMVKGQTANFVYTGSAQTWTVPPCVNSINVTVAGAKGGGSTGGTGAILTATIAVTPGQVLNIYVGGMGTVGNASGGFNGGGTGRASTDGNSAYHSCGGGGASDIRIGGTALSNRVIVAGGGGGKGGGSSQVCGGNAACVNGLAGCSTYGAGGGGGTQTAGGTGGAPWAGTPPGGTAGVLGIGGGGGLWQTASGGGGGGGYYGGGGGGNDGCCTGANGGGGGGGGSSLLPAGGACSPTGNTGNGYVNISYTASTPTAPGAITGPVTVCPGQTATYTINAVAGATSYNWSVPSGTTVNSGAGTTSITVTFGSTSGNVSVQSVTPCGISTASNLAVTVAPLPTVAATASPASICIGNSSTLTATGAASYVWSTSATGPTTVVSPTATTTYTVTGTSAAGCVNTANVTVTVNALPVVTATATPPAICVGATSVLTANGATTYTWSPNTNLSATTGTTVNANPTSTITYTVTGTNGNGCVNTGTVTLTVNPLPVITATAASGTICDGDTETLTGNGGVSYVWSSGGTNPTESVSPTVTTTYTVTGTDANGCVSTGDVTVNVTPNPVVTVNSPTICIGQTATLTANGATTYDWVADPTLSSISGSPVDANPTTTTTYTVTGTENGCSTTVTSTVTVNALPVISVNSPTICAGQTANLTATGGVSYVWTPGAGLNGTLGATQTANPSATTTYSLNGTDANGCTNSATTTVTVTPLPIVTASNNGPACVGTPVQFTATANGTGTFSWSGPSSFTNSSSSPSIASIAAGNAGVYTVTATVQGCSSSATTTLVVNPSIPSTITPSGPHCLNASPVTLTGATGGGVWSGTGISNANSGVFDPSLAGVGMHTITYAVSGNCGTTSTTQIEVLAIPTVAVHSDVTTGCVPLAITFADASAPTAVSSTWTIGNLITGTGTTFATEIPNVGCFNVTLTSTAANGCSNTASFPNYVCVVAPPIAGITVNPAEAPIVDPHFQFFNASDNETSVVWDFGDGTSSTSDAPEHTYAGAAGSYSVQLIAFNDMGCSDTTHTIVTVKEQVLFFVPNSFTPNGDEHNNSFKPVFTSGMDPYNFNFTIYNRWGEILFESNNPEFEWDGTYHEEIVPSGTYTWTCRFKSPTNDEKFEYSGHLNVLR